MPPEIADSLGELLDDGGGILLAPGDSGFVLLKPDDNGMHFGTKTDGDGHRVMDISELNPDEMADALSKVDQKTLVEVVVRMTTQRRDLDGASCLADAWVGLSQATGLELATVFRNGLDRGLITPDRLQAAVDG